MRDIPVALMDALKADASRFCTCWLLTRSDGFLLGVTDHDRPLSFDGHGFDPSSAVTTPAVRAEAGFEISATRIDGALSHDGISEADILAGLWDDARVDIWLVAWDDPALRLLLDVGKIGDIRRQDGAFAAELRGVMQRLNDVQGRRYLPRCDATLGDARCGVDLSTSAFRVSAVVESVPDARTVVVNVPQAAQGVAFEQGMLTRQDGMTFRIQSHGFKDGKHQLTLFDGPDPILAINEAVTLVFGCNKRFRTCRDVFGNVANFRGFPHIPGSAFVFGAQKPGTGLVGPRE